METAQLTDPHRADADPVVATQASRSLRLACAAAYVAYAVFAMVLSPQRAEGGPELFGRFLGNLVGAFLVPMIFVGIAALWKRNRTQRRLYQVYLWATLALVAAPGTMLLRSLRGAGSGRPWVYQSEDQRFSLTLPSSRWQRSAKPTHVADFWFPDMSPMLASVTSIEEQSLAAFSDSNPEGWRPSSGIQRGESSAGNPYMLASWREDEHAETGARTLAVAACRIWLANKGLTLAMVFERHGKMLSQLGQTTETRELQTEAKAICLSAR